LESFLMQGLWDEIRVETNPRLTVSDGTRAPQLPATAQVVGCHCYDGNQIVEFF
jgi:diaminohydroxyphosphoribosylaminopyrimidine deaminase/5-amino-6-(5-phosphoribosylamino)uracil reductase